MYCIPAMNNLISLLVAASFIYCATSAGPLQYRYPFAYSPYTAAYARSYYLNGVVPPVAPYTAAKVAPVAPVAPVVPQVVPAVDFYNYAALTAAAPYSYYDYNYPLTYNPYFWKK